MICKYFYKFQPLKNRAISLPGMDKLLKMRIWVLFFIFVFFQRAVVAQEFLVIETTRDRTPNSNLWSKYVHPSLISQKGNQLIKVYWHHHKESLNSLCEVFNLRDVCAERTSDFRKICFSSDFNFDEKFSFQDKVYTEELVAPSRFKASLQIEFQKGSDTITLKSHKHGKVTLSLNSASPLKLQELLIKMMDNFKQCSKESLDVSSIEKSITLLNEWKLERFYGFLGQPGVSKNPWGMYGSCSKIENNQLTRRFWVFLGRENMIDLLIQTSQKMAENANTS